MKKFCIAFMLLSVFILTMTACKNNTESSLTDISEMTGQSKQDTSVSENESISESETVPKTTANDTENLSVSERETTTETTASDTENATATVTTQSETAKQKGVTVTVNGVSFEVELADNDTAAAFEKLLPTAFSMQELNGNEKFIFLDSSLPSSSSAVGFIRAGDLMLYGDNCVVLFYDSFITTYSYTRIGRITDTSGLAAAVGTGNVTAEFSVR